jgi:hypothetical protein
VYIRWLHHLFNGSKGSVCFINPLYLGWNDDLFTVSKPIDSTQSYINFRIVLWYRWSEFYVAYMDEDNLINIWRKESRDSSVGIALGYGQDNRGSRVRFKSGAGNFSLHHHIRTGSGAHPASYPMGTRGSFRRSKAAGAWSWAITSI